MLPTREEALKLIRDGLLFNPGPWGKHCLTAAHCAEKIASACGDMDVEKAYILGLLHDIGRKFGVRHLGHVYDGYVYMKSLGYDEVAKICLTHSFNNHTIDEYIGKFDVTDEELTIIKTELAKTIYDEYDRLIQLCDCLAGAEGVLDIENSIEKIKAEKEKDRYNELYGDIIKNSKKYGISIDQTKFIKPKWYIQNRLNNESYKELINASDNIKKLGNIFPLIFFAISILVSLISMMRMIE